MPSNTSGPYAIVVGAGISGLTAAHELKKAGYGVTVLEAEEFIGGKMSSVEHGPYRYNRAANILPTSGGTLLRLMKETGVGEGMETLAPRMGFLRGGTVHHLKAGGPAAALDFLNLKLLSFSSKRKIAHLVVDILRVRKSLSAENPGLAAPFDTESAAGYARRRLDEELLEYFVEPIVRALHTSNADQVSVVDFFFTAAGFVGTGFSRYPGGIDFLCRALADGLDVRLGARVTRVSRDGDTVTVGWTVDGVAQTETADAVVLAVGAHEIPRLYPQLPARQREILTHHIGYAATFAAHFGLTARPDNPAHLVPVPKSESEGLCVVAFDHNLNPSSAPPGKGLLTSYWLHEWSVLRRGMSDEELTAEMLKELEKAVPGIRELLAFSAIDRWNEGVVRSYPGMYAKVGEFNRLVEPTSPVQMAGDYLSNSSTNGSALSGEIAARRIVAALGSGN
ncbi:protoporphyrinogen/coproporphyrinogen oxidase [Streptomyces justiciae]|uniref:protoporphyrinogen/coproporphyrinogen oxidase n=1 Tax=Streptomyces justiciae TaxID=2780140 RepID=UPI0021183A32|nr:NAD(P)/FAD-dependent oxidoreductase [Streptomyces justiciae]MCW8379731.1 FAD-dependent oxidoreductase [Streptomyces justiciae]